MAEAIDRVRELGNDRRIDVRGRVEHERIDRRLNAARKLFEHQVLILHFGGEARGLEQALAVPLQVGRNQRLNFRGREGGCHVDAEPLVQECDVAVGDDRRLVDLEYAVVL